MVTENNIFKYTENSPNFCGSVIGTAVETMSCRVEHKQEVK
jgi:hypothetical protein